MDYIFISKITLVGTLYLITNYFYKRKDVKSGFLFYLITGIYGFAMLISFIVCFFLVGFTEFLKFLASRLYYEQMIILFGCIGLFYSFRMIYDSYYEKEDLVKELKNKIQILESEKNIIERDRN